MATLVKGRTSLASFPYVLALNSNGIRLFLWETRS